MIKNKEYYLKFDNLYDRALLLASDLFENRKDKEGLPYINHLIRVSANLDTVELKIAGLLHDTLEDTRATKKDLIELGFSEKVISIIEGVTNKKGEDYDAKIQRIIDSNDIDMIKVKFADMSDNYDKYRMKLLSKEVRDKLTKKYDNNLKLLKKELLEYNEKN